MSKRSRDMSNLKSWRGIQQRTTKRPLTHHAWKKRLWSWVKMGGVISFIVIFSVVGVMCAQKLNEYSSSSNVGVKIEKIYFETDGVLSEKWLGRVLGLSKGVAVMDVDIFQLKQALETQGQIKEARVERVFPNALRISLNEYHPILRLLVEDPPGKRKLLVVSSEGVPYEGVNYNKSLLKRLPYLSGVQVKKENDGSFSSLKGIETVSALLKDARQYTPYLYPSWSVISCDDFDGRTHAPGAIIKVRTKSIDEIVFMPYSFKEQLERLSYVLEYSRDHKMPSMRRVDLSLGDQVVVQYSQNVVTLMAN